MTEPQEREPDLKRLHAALGLSPPLDKPQKPKKEAASVEPEAAKRARPKALPRADRKPDEPAPDNTFLYMIGGAIVALFIFFLAAFFGFV